MPDEKLTKDQRRNAAREAARVLREKQKRSETRRRIALIGGASVAILAVLGVAAFIVVQSMRPAGPGPLNMASDGIVLTGSADKIVAQKTAAIPDGGTPAPAPSSTADAAPLKIVMYVDYQCPFCQQFEATNAEQIQSWVTSSIASLEIHPIAILDKTSLGSRYSSRAANAAACVANFAPNSYLAVNTTLFANQPKEQTSGLTTTELVNLIKKAGVTSSNVESCIRDETFKGWVAAATKRATSNPALEDSNGSFGTPTVLVNGKRYTGPLGDDAAFSSFAQQQYTGK
ncbi:MAG TPA: thioredoxin domain-containing protein [Pseudolysinimonas sp.]|nr:thioredoxin domain-containing protein [Pseudolysinimonas sp.]